MTEGDGIWNTNTMRSSCGSICKVSPPTLVQARPRTTPTWSSSLASSKVTFSLPRYFSRLIDHALNQHQLPGIAAAHLPGRDSNDELLLPVKPSVPLRLGHALPQRTVQHGKNNHFIQRVIGFLLQVSGFQKGFQGRAHVLPAVQLPQIQALQRPVIGRSAGRAGVSGSFHADRSPAGGSSPFQTNLSPVGGSGPFQTNLSPAGGSIMFQTILSPTGGSGPFRANRSPTGGSGPFRANLTHAVSPDIS